MFVGLSRCYGHIGVKSFNFNLHVSVSDQMLNANCGSVLLGNNFLVLFFFLQERPDSTAVGAAFGVTQTSPFSTGEEHEIATLLPGNDQHH